ncbi:MAG TPA: BON domain-containing protein [Longimicrobium sp.]|nr:BON domain-containing protein [Longimicrobium sp.]
MARYDNGFGGQGGFRGGWTGRPDSYDEDFGYDPVRYGRWDEPSSGMRGAQGAQGGYGGPQDRGGFTFGGGRQGGYGGGMSRGGPTFGGGQHTGGHGGAGYGGGQRGYNASRDGWGEGWGGGYDAYDRGIYGESYPGYGGYPGAPVRGEYYGGGGFGPGRASQGRGYGGDFARAPFMPEEAYRRHPEYNQPRQQRQWESYQHGYDEDLSDDDIREIVRGRMESDAWLDPDRIEVEVEDGVVTLTGEVDDFLEARYAWDDAWEAEGVRGVVNNLTVRTDQPTETHGDVVAQSSGDRPNLEAGGATLWSGGTEPES